MICFLFEDEQEQGVEQGVTEYAKRACGDEKENTIRDGGSTGALRITLLTLFTLFTLFSLFLLFKLLYSVQTVACMPLYIYC